MDYKDNNRASDRTDLVDFSFAYDDKNFSDRILRIKIMRDVQEVMSDGDSTASLKHRTICQQQEYDGEKTIFKVKTMHVSSAILAAKSPFFHKLFSNGMQESEQSDVTVHISCSEEGAFMELMNFIYCGTLVSPTPTAVILDTLKVAHKFEVPSCIHQCVAMLHSMTMTLESVSLFLSLPSCVQTIDVVQQLVKDAKGFLRKHFSQFKKFEKEYMQLPLVVIEEVLSSDELQVMSEDQLYDSVMKWAKAHYPNDVERMDVLRNKLIKSIRYPQMSYLKLGELLFDEEIRQVALDPILDAILFKAEPSRSRKGKTCTLNENHKKLCQRSYIYRPVSVLKFDTPVRECRVFWDIKKDQFLTGKTLKIQYSEPFCLRGQSFHLVAFYRGNEQAIQFCLHRHKQWIDSLNFILGCSFSVRSKPSNNFVKIFQDLVNIDNRSLGGHLFQFRLKGSIPMTDNVPHVINNVIHLQAVFTPSLR